MMPNQSSPDTTPLESHGAAGAEGEPGVPAVTAPADGKDGAISRWTPRLIGRSRLGRIEIATRSDLKLSIVWDAVLVHMGPEPYVFGCVGGLERLIWTQYLAHANAILNGSTMRLSGGKGEPGVAGGADGVDGSFELLDGAGLPVLTLEPNGEFYDRRQFGERPLLPSEVFARVRGWIFSNGIVG
jgi:hypothetical protein